MKRYKLVLICMVALGSAVAFSPLARAQDNKDAKPDSTPQPRQGGPRATPEERLAKLAKDLSLTDEQKEKVKPILMEQAEKRKELRADTGLSREDRRAKAKELTDAINAKLKTVLTPDQLEKYQKMSMQRRRQQPPATPPQPAPQQ